MTAVEPVSVALGDIVTFQKGKPPAQQPYYGHDLETYLTPEFLRGGTMAEPIKAGRTAVRVSDGETIVLWDGSNAGEVFKGRRGVLSSTMTLLKHQNSFDPNYFFYAVKHLEPRLKAQTAGSGIPHVDKEVLGKMSILRFEIPEQYKIAEIFLILDGAIDAVDALLAKRQRIHTGLMQTLFTRGIDDFGRLLEQDGYEDSALGRIPLGWSVTPAENLCAAVLDCKNRTPPLAKEGHPVIRTPNVRNGEFVLSDLVYTDAHSYEVWTARGKPRSGDVVITREAPFGEACQIPRAVPEPCLGQRMMMYQTNPVKLNPEYLVYAIYSEAVQSKLLELAGGSTVGHIRVGDIRKLPIPHPVSVQEQSRIAEILTKSRTALSELGDRRQKLVFLKNALAQDILTGRKRVTALLKSVAEQEKKYAVG